MNLASDIGIDIGGTSSIVLGKRKTVKSVILELLAKHKTISIGDVSRFLMRAERSELTHEISNTIEEMDADGLIQIISNNPQITYLRTADAKREKVNPRRKRVEFTFPKGQKFQPIPDYLIR